ncbi:MAG: GNAT family N-acetyltransferase [Acidobacteria bacterium]|nr:GNAT family N-acetyltransferase [Acidobacteriota bacterium]
MARQFIRDLTVGDLSALPTRCRGCLFWELAPIERAFASEHDPEFEKEAWFSEVSLVVGACGKVAYSDNDPVGYALFGPPEIFPGALSFPARVSKDALLLATLHVLPVAEREGIGRALVHAALREAKGRGKRAVEAFGDRQWRHPDCVIPAEFLEKVGFRVRREHVRFPLLRIDVRSLGRIAEDAAAAVEKLLESVFRPEPAAKAAP